MIRRLQCGGLRYIDVTTEGPLRSVRIQRAFFYRCVSAVLLFTEGVTIAAASISSFDPTW